jgi:hypothetical protein
MWKVAVVACFKALSRHSRRLRKREYQVYEMQLHQCAHWRNERNLCICSLFNVGGSTSRYIASSHWMIMWWIVNMYEQVFVASFRQCSSIFLDGLRNSTKNLRIVGVPTELRTPPEYKSETLGHLARWTNGMIKRKKKPWVYCRAVEGRQKYLRRRNVIIMYFHTLTVAAWKNNPDIWFSVDYQPYLPAHETMEWAVSFAYRRRMQYSLVSLSIRSLLWGKGAIAFTHTVELVSGKLAQLG